VYNPRALASHTRIFPARLEDFGNGRDDRWKGKYTRTKFHFLENNADVGSTAAKKVKSGDWSMVRIDARFATDCTEISNAMAMIQMQRALR
jgi:hypothetical protein